MTQHHSNPIYTQLSTLFNCYNLHLLLYSIYCYFCNPIKGNFPLHPLHSNSIGWPIKWISTKTEIISWIARIKCRISSFFLLILLFFVHLRYLQIPSHFTHIPSQSIDQFNEPKIWTEPVMSRDILLWNCVVCGCLFEFSIFFVFNSNFLTT